MTIDYFAVAVGAARQAADKVLGEPRAVIIPRREQDPALCIVCQAEPHGEEDDTCGSRVCRETWFSEFWERM